MTDSLCLAVLGGLAFSHFVAFALGRLTGMEAAFERIRTLGRLEKIPLHTGDVNGD